MKMKKKKDGPLKANWITAIVFLVLATILRMMKVEIINPNILYAGAALFYILWQFDKTNWLILDIARMFVDSMKPPEERSGK